MLKLKARFYPVVYIDTILYELEPSESTQNSDIHTQKMLSNNNSTHIEMLSTKNTETIDWSLFIL